MTWLRDIKAWDKRLDSLISTEPLQSRLGSITGLTFKFSSMLSADVTHVLQKADVSIFNPKSNKRYWQLEKAQQIALTYRSGETPVGVVTGAMREDQRIVVTTLGRLHMVEVNMQTTVFVGNSTARRYGDFIYTLRGYARKYEF